MKTLIEDNATEFKRTWVDGAKRSAVAFANTNGGTIYLGIEDDGTIRGLDNIDETMRRATQAISDGVRPDMMNFVSIEMETMHDTPIIAVHIQRGTRRPYYLADKGIRPAGVYIRSGAASIPASESAIVDMIRQTAGDSFEDAVSLNQQLTFAAAKNAFEAADMAFTDSSQRTLSMINEDGVYTNLAWLLSDQCTTSIKAAVFGDNDKEVFLNRQEFTGSLLTQFAQVNEFIAHHNTVNSYTSSTLRRIDDYDYSPLVLREALLNLIVHRDYGLSGPALISIFGNRIEFLNLGGLPARLTQADMLNGISSQRNPKLANIFYRMGFIEAYGTGIRRIIGDYSNEDVKPQFSISDHSFRLTLPKHVKNVNNDENRAQLAYPTSLGDINSSGHSNNTLTDHEQKILSYVEAHGTITRKQAQEVTGLAQASTANVISKLIKHNLLIRIGKGPSTMYRLAE